jgi:hypothetical protein
MIDFLRNISNTHMQLQALGYFSLLFYTQPTAKDEVRICILNFHSRLINEFVIDLNGLSLLRYKNKIGELRNLFCVQESFYYRHFN